MAKWIKFKGVNLEVEEHVKGLHKFDPFFKKWFNREQVIKGFIKQGPDETDIEMFGPKVLGTFAGEKEEGCWSYTMIKAEDIDYYVEEYHDGNYHQALDQAFGIEGKDGQLYIIFWDLA